MRIQTWRRLAEWCISTSMALLTELEVRRSDARLDRGQLSFQPISLNEIVDEVLSLMHSELVGRGVELLRDLAPGLPPVTVDTGSGASSGSFKGRATGAGPVLSDARKLGKTNFADEIKRLPEFAVEKRLKGNYMWIKLGFVF